MLYFFIFMILVGILFIYHVSSGSIFYSNIILIFTVLLLPLFDKFYDLFSEHLMNYRIKNIFYVFFDFGLPIIWGIFFLSGYLNIVFFLAWLAVWAIFRWWDSRIFFAWAFLTFCYVVFYLLFNRNVMAEELSLIVYYILITAVCIQIGQSLWRNNSQSI